MNEEIPRREILAESEKKWVDQTLKFFKDDWETINWLEDIAKAVYPPGHIEECLREKKQVSGKIIIEVPFEGRWRGFREHYIRYIKK